jgi:uncharacterized Zn finger protein
MTLPAPKPARYKQRPPAGSFKVGMEITNRSGSITRAYRLLLLPGRVRIAYASGQVYYELRCDAETGAVTCTCPAFAEEGECKHRDAVVALMDGLSQRLTQPAENPVPASA